MDDRSLAEWLAMLETRHPSEIEMGLGRVNDVWQSLQAGRTKYNTLVITVAGTNGKGSCLACMQALLLEHGYSVGLFTSPHFLTYNERICLAGEPVSDAVIVAAFEEIEAHRGDVSLTYFEFGTLAALVVFRDAGPDVMLLEVGLGGRLDAINIIDADVAVVTSIDLDHQSWLGDTREEIAGEKLGIARANRPLIIGEQNFPVGFEEMVASTGADGLFVGRDFSFTREALFVANLKSPNGVLVIDQLDSQGLLPLNKTLALQALMSAGISLDTDICRQVLAAVMLRGRHQWVGYRGLSVILDVAHNPAAANVLAENLPAITGRTLAVASVLDDKDWSGIVAELTETVDDWFIAEISDSSRALSGQTLLELLYNTGQSAQLLESVVQAFFAAVAEATVADRVVVFGSFHTVSAVLQVILAEVSSE